jgi:HD-like signal output (HDOD) protein/CheY-like chemotaxis protein
MTRPEILFIDDEPQVLSGLRRALYQRSDIWHLRTAQSGAAALEYLANHPVDILVTDMRMPGMDGAELLERVRQLHPATTRIVLSGYAGQESIISVAGTAQQYLVKPCEPAVLIAVLKSALAARALIEDPVLSSLLGEAENLPKPPAICAELTALIHGPETTIAEVARLVERDLAMTAELLKLVNSSFFGLRQEVISVEQAVTLLGLDVIRALVLEGRIFRPGSSMPADLAAADLAGRGIRASIALRQAADVERLGADLVRRLSLAALFYDLGMLVLAANRPDSWARYGALKSLLPARDAQMEAFGVTFGRAGGYVLGLWGFHPDIVNALAEQPIAFDDAIARLQASEGGLAVAEARAAAALGAAESATS